MGQHTSIDQAFRAAIAGVDRPSIALFNALEELPAPAYVVDAAGTLIYFNPACTNFAGRVPTVGQDRWCVSWKLYSNDGQPMAHDACPMAQALAMRQPVSGKSAVAERPDGTRRRFQPHPVPLIDGEGNLTGGINLLIDISDAQKADDLRHQALRCRRLATEANNDTVAEALLALACEYEEQADRLDSDRSSFSAAGDGHFPHGDKSG